MADFVLRQTVTGGATTDFAWVSAQQQIFSPATGLHATDTPALTVTGLVNALLAAFGAEDALSLPESKRFAALTRRLHAVPFLIVIDNLETAAAASRFAPADQSRKIHHHQPPQPAHPPPMFSA